MSSSCNRKHNVLILENEFGMGGSEKKLFEFLSRIDKDHFAVKVCCLKEGGYFKDKLEDLGVPFYESILRHKYDAFVFKRLRRIIEDENVDLIYTFAHPNTVLLSYLARARGLVDRFIVSFHATGSPTGGALVKPYLKPFLDAADRLLAVAHSHKRYLVERERLDGPRIDVIHNGVDIERYAPGVPRNGLGDELGIKEGEVVVTTVASLKPAKRIDNLLEAMARLDSGMPNTRVVVVGGGPEADGLRSLAESLGIGESVTFAGVRDDIDEILRASDLFVLASRPGTETFPNVILEAMATALPVVATEVGSVAELVEDGRSGIIVAPDDIERLTGALAQVISSDDVRAKYGMRGREIVEESFRIEGMCHRREAVFSKLLCETPAA